MQLPLLKSGSVKVGKKKGVGQILITERAIFLFNDSSGAMTGGVLGGLIGYLIGQAVDRHATKKAPPVHMGDQEILALDQKLRSKLCSATIAAKFPLDPSLSIEVTRIGFRFRSGDVFGEYGGWPHKKEMLKFFKDKNLAVKQE